MIINDYLIFNKNLHIKRMDKVDFYNGFVALSWRDVLTIRYYHFSRYNLRRIMFPACEKLMNAHIRIYDLQNKQLIFLGKLEKNEYIIHKYDYYIK